MSPRAAETSTDLSPDLQVVKTVERRAEEPPVAQRNLHQRIAAVQAETEGIHPTGRNQFNATAISISDVEDAIRKPFALHSIVTRWSYVALEQIDKGLWRAHLRVRLHNADDPADVVDDEWIDIGGNPMAATSFARKGYYKALLHLAEDDEDALPTQGQRHVPAPIRYHDPAATSEKAQMAGEVREGDPCQLCTEAQASGVDVKAGKYRLYRGHLQCTGKVNGEWANHPAPDGPSLPNADLAGPLRDEPDELGTSR